MSKKVVSLLTPLKLKRFLSTMREGQLPPAACSHSIKFIPLHKKKKKKVSSSNLVSIGRLIQMSNFSHRGSLTSENINFCSSAVLSLF